MPAAAVPELQKLADDIRVILASRTGGGEAFRCAYAFAGSSAPSARRQDGHTLGPVAPLNGQSSAELASNGDLELLGARLRDLRLRRAMTLKDVASQTGMSPSMVSQLERGLVAPSLATLYSLAQFYETGLAELFQESHVVENEVVRRGDRTVVHLPRSNASYELLGRSRQDLQMFEMVMAAGEGHADHTISHPGEECVLVLEGQVRARVGTQEFQLEEGDSLQYSATLPHTYEVREGESARLIVAITPPVL